MRIRRCSLIKGKLIEGTRQDERRELFSFRKLLSLFWRRIVTASVNDLLHARTRPGASSDVAWNLWSAPKIDHVRSSEIDRVAQVGRETLRARIDVCGLRLSRHRFNYEWETGNVAETGNETAILQMNARTVVSVLAIYLREQKVTYRDAVMKERQNFSDGGGSLSRHKAVMQLPFFLYDTECTRLQLIMAFAYSEENCARRKIIFSRFCGNNFFPSFFPHSFFPL